MSNPNPSATPSPFRRPLLLVILLAMVLAAIGLASRMRARAALDDEIRHENVIRVVVTHPIASDDHEALVLPGTLQAFSDATLYAQTTGYIRRWSVDIGASVHAGQLMAEIDTPEVDQQWAQAQADLMTAQANERLAQTTAQRWLALAPSHTVSQQDVDNKVGDAAAKQAALASAEANLKRLEELERFKQIRAPFDGIVTARSIDNGDLVSPAGANGKPQALFQIADIRRLRLYVQVPEARAGDIRIGVRVPFIARENPTAPVEATLTTTAHAIDPVNHTLLAELEIDNHHQTLMPGGYGEAHFALPSPSGSVRISANTLLFRPAGMQVAVLQPDQRIKLQTVRIGRDFGPELEVLEGLTPEQLIVLNPADSLIDGQSVKATQTNRKNP